MIMLIIVNRIQFLYYSSYFIKGICSCEVILYNFAFEVGNPLSSNTFSALGILSVSGKSELNIAC